MKSKFFLSLALLLIAGTLSASAQKFTKGTDYLSATVGVGNDNILPIAVQYEKGVYDINADMAIGAGAHAGLAFLNKSSLFSLAASGTYHYTAFESWDLYGALRLGFINTEWDSEATPVFWDFNVGARYFFNEEFAAMVELGSNISYFNLGVTYAF